MLVQVSDDTVVNIEKILGIQLLKKTNDPVLADGWWFEILMIDQHIYYIETQEWIESLDIMIELYDSNKTKIEEFYEEGEDGRV